MISGALSFVLITQCLLQKENNVMVDIKKKNKIKMGAIAERCDSRLQWEQGLKMWICDRADERGERGKTMSGCNSGHIIFESFNSTYSQRGSNLTWRTVMSVAQIRRATITWMRLITCWGGTWMEHSSGGSGAERERVCRGRRGEERKSWPGRIRVSVRRRGTQ